MKFVRPEIDGRLRNTFLTLALVLLAIELANFALVIPQLRFAGILSPVFIIICAVTTPRPRAGANRR